MVIWKPGYTRRDVFRNAMNELFWDSKTNLPRKIVPHLKGPRYHPYLRFNEDELRMPSLRRVNGRWQPTQAQSGEDEIVINQQECLLCIHEMENAQDVNFNKMKE